MATASANPDVSSRVIEKGLTCNICLNLLKEPKDLDCPHVFCLECLWQWVKKKPTVECPECRYITVVPQGGLANLKTNLRLKNMVEDYVKGESTKDAEKQNSAPKCPDHDGERQHFVCITCGIMVCHNCLVLKHPQPRHEIKELKEVKKAEGEKSRELDEIKVKLEAAKQQAEKEVEARAQEIMVEVEAQKIEMIQSIQTIYQQRVDTLNKDRESWLQKRSSTTRNVSGRMKQHESVIGRIDKLSITQDIPAEDMTTLQFNPGSGSWNSSWFGELVTSSRRERKLTFVTEFSDFQQAQDVAVTQTGLVAVVDYMRQNVSIYRNVSGEYKNQFCIRITRPMSVAVTSEGKFLVCNGMVNVFSREGTYEKSWSKSIFADRITTTSDDMIVIGSHNKRVINVHQSNGAMIRTHQADCENIIDIASNGKQIAFTTGCRGKVCVIDFVTGQTLWTVDMEYPLGICYEQKSNTLLVAGGSWYQGKNVIQQYCSTTGRLISRLASGLYGPLAMTTTHDNKLVVADAKTVKIYNIQ